MVGTSSWTYKEEKMMLFPNCSEYVQRIHMSPLEKRKARELLDKMNFDDKDKGYIEEYFDEGNQFSAFTSEEFVEPYNLITETILADRKVKILKAVSENKLTLEQAKELEVGLQDGKTYLDIEIDEIIEDYERYKSLVTKAKILDNLENSDKKKQKWEI